MTTVDLAGLRFFIRTFGCQMNVHDSERMAGLLAGAGAVPAGSEERAGLVLVNTCAVRAKSEEKLFSYLGRLAHRKKRRPFLIAVVGCVAQLRRAELFRLRPEIDFVIGPARLHELPAIVSESAAARRVSCGPDRAWRETGPQAPLRETPGSGFVTVMEGCDNFCAYCVVPFTRGRETSRPFADILEEVRALAAEGRAEAVLLGQNVNSYRDPESGRGFPHLLRAAAAEGPEWVRFLTSHPRDFTPELILAMADSPRVCRQVHLPLQAGSTRILDRMNRGYAAEEYFALVDRLRAAMPGIHLSTDIIVGFPGETEEDFEDTMAALRRIRYSNIFSFRYSPRPLTAAARLEDDVNPEVKRRRLTAVQALQRSIQAGLHEAMVGRTLRVLCDGRSRKDAGVFAGRAEGGQVVNFTAGGESLGRFVEVLITSCGPYSLRGEAM